MADIAASVLARLKKKKKKSGRSYQLCLQLFVGRLSAGKLIRKPLILVMF